MRAIAAMRWPNIAARSSSCMIPPSS
jgi:hypothetical protein